jgi:hypothetical protein
MHTFKNVAFFLIMSVTFALNARLYMDGAGILLYSSQDYDPWYVDCHYYKPVKIFQTRMPVQGECKSFAMEE